MCKNFGGAQYIVVFMVKFDVDGGDLEGRTGGET